MELRRVFDTIPEKFDRWRPKYCKEAFDCIIRQGGIDGSKQVLEIGPGTGQATEPILETGCDYLAIELGEHLYTFMQDKFSRYENFHIVNGDFENYDFQNKKFDCILSAAAIQWIPEQIAFSNCFDLLKSGGCLAMLMIHGDYRIPDEALYRAIQKVYSEHFHPQIPYRQKMVYGNAVKYGFVDFQEFKFTSSREFSAEEYVQYLGTHSDHAVLAEPEKTKFFHGILHAIRSHGNRIRFKDTIVLYLAHKP